PPPPAAVPSESAPTQSALLNPSPACPAKYKADSPPSAAPPRAVESLPVSAPGSPSPDAHRAHPLCRTHVALARSPATSLRSPRSRGHTPAAARTSATAHNSSPLPTTLRRANCRSPPPPHRDSHSTLQYSAAAAPTNPLPTTH